MNYEIKIEYISSASGFNFINKEIREYIEIDFIRGSNKEIKNLEIIIDSQPIDISDKFITDIYLIGEKDSSGFPSSYRTLYSDRYPSYVNRNSIVSPIVSYDLEEYGDDYEIIHCENWDNPFASLVRFRLNIEDLEMKIFNDFYKKYSSN